MKDCPISAQVSGTKAHYSSLITALVFSAAVVFAAATVSAQQAGPATGARIWLADRQPVASNYGDTGAVAISSASGVRRIPGDDSGQPATTPAQILSSGKSTALSLISADLNGDGVGDVAAGYAAPGGGGILAVHYGSLDALAPQSDASFQAIGRGDFPAPFLRNARVISVPVAPDFIAAGNFSGHGTNDLVVAARGSNLVYLLPGDGRGNFSAPQAINLDGAVTAVSSGKLGRAGLAGDLIVGITGQTGSSLLVYQGATKGPRLVGTYSVGGPVSSIAFGNLTGHAGADAAIVAGGELWILGSASRQLEKVALPVTASAVVTGSFIYDRAGRTQMALLGADGSVYIVVRSGIDSRPLSNDERRQVFLAAVRGLPSPVLPAPNPGEGWVIAESFALHASQQSVLLRTRISSNAADDVMVLNGAAGQMAVISHPNLPQGANTFVAGEVSRRSYSGSPIAAVSMHVNIDGRPGVVALNRGESAPSVMMPLPDPVFNVNTTADVVVANACANNVANSCSLREAIIEANADNLNDTINVPAGTYTLTLTGPNKETAGATASYGSLDIFHGLTINGAVDGSGNPATIVQAGTDNTNGIDKVFAVNPNADPGFDTHFSNLVIRFGKNPGSFRGGVASVIPHGFGGGLFWEGSQNGNMSVVNCIITDNSTTDGDGGGIAIDSNGTATIGTATGNFILTSSTVQNNSVQESSTGNSGKGGGIFVTGGTAITMTSNKVLNNSATQTANGGGQGGGMFLGSPGNGNIRSVFRGGSISGNTAVGHGGGIFTGQGLVIDNSGGALLITGNSGDQGGGIWNSLTNDTTTISKATITGNTATGSDGTTCVNSCGGGVFAADTGVATSNLVINFSRLTNNTAAAGSNFANLGAASSQDNATNNWWGLNSPAGSIFDANGAVTFDPFIVLTHTANPSSIPVNGSSTLTGDMSSDNHGSGLTLSGNLDVLNGLPITFNNAVLGTIAEAQPESLSSGAQATATYNAGNTPGAGSADATVDQQTVTARISVVLSPSIAKAFNPSGIQPNGVSLMTITLSNTSSSSFSGIAFTDNFPAGLVVADNSLSNTCGGAATGAAGATTVSLTGGSLAANTSCAVSVNVTSGTAGTYVNNTGPVSSTEGGTGLSASATLAVAVPPTISKVFVPDTITLSGQSALSFTINNPNSTVTLTGIQFTDNLPAGLQVASPNGVSNSCDGTVTAVPGSTSISFSGGDLGPPSPALRPVMKGMAMGSPRFIGPMTSAPTSNGSCFISVEIKPTIIGTFNNTTGPISANESGAGTTSNQATLTVNPTPVVTPPTAAKAFGAAFIPVNGTTSLTFTITNPNSSTTLLNVSISDNLPGGLVVSNPSAIGGSCIADGGSVNANSGSASITLSGAELPPSSSCSFSVNVTGVSSGVQNNVSGNVTALFDDGTGTLVATTGNQATASIVVLVPPSIAKSFNPSLIAPTGVSVLSFTITNPSQNPVPLTGISFTDTLPANVFVASPSGATGNCNTGTFTANAGSGTISLSGGTILPNSSCTVSANVTSAVTGSYTNSVTVTSDNGGTGNTASATLTVKPANLSITKTHPVDDFDFNRKSTGTYTITVSDDPNAGPTLGTVTVTDNLPDVNHTFVPVSMTGTGWTCNLATLTCTRSDSLAPGASYPPILLVVNVPQNITANVTNTATVSGGGDPNSHTASDPTHINPPLGPELNGPLSLTVTKGGSASTTFTFNTKPAAGVVTFGCSGLPEGASCTFDPPSTSRMSPLVTLTVDTSSSSASATPLSGPRAPLYALIVSVVLGAGLGSRKSLKKHLRLRLAFAAIAVVLLLGLVSCGGNTGMMNATSSSPSMSPSTFTVTVTATSATSGDAGNMTLNLTLMQPNNH